MTSPAHRSGDTTTAWPCEDTQCTSRVWKPVVGTPQGVLHADQRDACHLYIGEAVLVGEGEGVAETLGLPLTLPDPDRDTVLVSERELELV